LCVFWVLNVGVRYSWIGVRSLCVEYAWLCAVHASAVSAYASELVRNRARPRPSTDAPPSYHAWTAHASRSSWNGSVWKRFVSDRACVASRTVFARIRRRARYFSDSSVIVNETCAVHAWFMRDSSGISTPDTPKISRSLDAQARTNPICAWFVSDSCVYGYVTGPLHVHTKDTNGNMFAIDFSFSRYEITFFKLLHVFQLSDLGNMYQTFLNYVNMLNTCYQMQGYIYLLKVKNM